jgi:hypothetical protein
MARRANTNNFKGKVTQDYNGNQQNSGNGVAKPRGRGKKGFGCWGDNYHTANKGLVRIQCKCLVPIYVFPVMKLCGIVISKKEL